MRNIAACHQRPAALSSAENSRQKIKVHTNF